MLGPRIQTICSCSSISQTGNVSRWDETVLLFCDIVQRACVLTQPSCHLIKADTVPPAVDWLKWNGLEFRGHELKKICAIWRTLFWASCWNWSNDVAKSIHNCIFENFLKDKKAIIFLMYFICYTGIMKRFE